MKLNIEQEHKDFEEWFLRRFPHKGKESSASMNSFIGFESWAAAKRAKLSQPQGEPVAITTQEQLDIMNRGGSPLTMIWHPSKRTHAASVELFTAAPVQVAQEPVAPTMTLIAHRNLSSYIRNAEFKCNVDRIAALNCLEVLISAIEVTAAPAQPVKPVPLSDERVEILAVPFVGTSYSTGERVDYCDVIGIARAIEAEHGILAAQEVK